MRILILLISLAIVVFLFYQYISHPLVNNSDLVPANVDTPSETVNYARDATKKVELQDCLRLCTISEDQDIDTCQADCQDRFGS